MTKYPSHLIIAIIVAAAILWFNFFESNVPKSSIFNEEYKQQEREDSQQDNKTFEKTLKQIDEKSKQVASSTGKDIRQIENLLLPKMNKKIELIERDSVAIIELRKKLDEINGDYESLESIMAYSLARSLSICASKPKTAPGWEDYENRVHFATGGAYDTGFFRKMCSGITTEEYDMVYSLTERAANDGVHGAIMSFANARSIPGYIESDASTFAEESSENQEALLEHTQKSTSMLEELVAKGDIQAAFRQGILNSIGSRQPVNKKKALSYLLAFSSASKDQKLVESLNQNIEQIVGQLYDPDIIEARQQALKIVNQWEKLDILYN